MSQRYYYPNFRLGGFFGLRRPAWFDRQRTTRGGAVQIRAQSSKVLPFFGRHRPLLVRLSGECGRRFWPWGVVIHNTRQKAPRPIRETRTTRGGAIQIRAQSSKFCLFWTAPPSIGSVVGRMRAALLVLGRSYPQYQAKRPPIRGTKNQAGGAVQIRAQSSKVGGFPGPFAQSLKPDDISGCEPSFYPEIHTPSTEARWYRLNPAVFEFSVSASTLTGRIEFAEVMG